MDSVFLEREGKLFWQYDSETLCIEPWGENSLRVRMTADPVMDANDWALTEPVPETDSAITFETIDVTDPWYRGEEWPQYHQTAQVATLTNGKISAHVNHEGWISFRNQRGEVLTEEYWRTRDRMNRYCVPQRVTARASRQAFCHSPSSASSRQQRSASARAASSSQAVSSRSRLTASTPRAGRR